MSGTPTELGSSNLNIIAEGANRSIFEQPLTLTVKKLVVTKRWLPDAFVGMPYIVTLKAIGGRPPYRFSGSPPSGLQLDSETGELSGTVRTFTNSTSFEVTIRDSQNNSESQTVSLRLRGTTILNSRYLPEGVTGEPYSTCFRVAGDTSPVIWKAKGDLVSIGLELDPTTGELSSTPSRPGDFLISVIAQASDGQERTFVLTINGPQGQTEGDAKAARLEPPIFHGSATTNRTSILAVGVPPLTEQMTEQVGDFFDWLLEIRLTGSQRQHIRERLIASWRKGNKSEIAGAQEILKLVSELKTLPESERRLVRQKLLPEFLTKFRMEPDDPTSQILLQAYSVARDTPSDKYRPKADSNARPQPAARAAPRPVRLKSFVLVGELKSNQPFTGRVTLDGPAPPGGFVITLRAQAPGSYVSYPLTVTVEEGKDSADFTGRVSTVPSQRSAQLVAEGGGSVIPVNVTLKP